MREEDSVVFLPDFKVGGESSLRIVVLTLTREDQVRVDTVPPWQSDPVSVCLYSPALRRDKSSSSASLEKINFLSLLENLIPCFMVLVP